MMGFCAKLRALDCRLDHTTDMYYCDALQHTILAMYLDVTKAYDNVHQGIVIRPLTDAGIIGSPQISIYECLKDRAH